LKQAELPLCRRGPRTGLPRQPALDRRSYLYPDDLLRIASAHDFALAQGLEWAVFISVLRTHVPGSTAKDLPAVQEQVFQALRRYCRRHDLGKLEFIWVRECQRRKLDHLHILTTIPDAHCEAVEAMLTTSVGFSNRGVVAKPAGNPFTLMRYFGKQVHPDLVYFDGGVPYRLRDYIGLEPSDDDLPLEARRSGVSKGLGPACRSRAGFEPLTSVDDLREFFSGERDNDKTARRRGWDAGPPDIDAPCSRGPQVQGYDNDAA